MNNNPNNNSNPQENSQFSFTPNFSNQPNNNTPIEKPNTFVPQENFNQSEAPNIPQVEPIKNPIPTNPNSKLDLAKANVTTSGKATGVIIFLFVLFSVMLIVGIIGFSLNIGKDIESINVGNFMNELFEEDTPYFQNTSDDELTDDNTFKFFESQNGYIYSVKIPYGYRLDGDVSTFYDNSINFKVIDSKGNDFNVDIAYKANENYQDAFEARKSMAKSVYNVNTLEDILTQIGVSKSMICVSDSITCCISYIDTNNYDMDSSVFVAVTVDGTSEDVQNRAIDLKSAIKSNIYIDF